MRTDQIGGLSAGGLAAATRAGKPWHDNGNSGAAITINAANGASQILTLTAAAVTITFDGLADGQGLTLRIVNTAGATITWASVTQWAGSAIPALSAAATAVDVFYFQGLPVGVYGQVVAWDVG